MKFGFRPMQGGNCFSESLKQVQVAEQAGFDSVWLTEHHGWDVSWPSPQVALAGFATVTESVSLGTSIILLPLANPVRLAGEFALLDEISGGRAILGVALGYQDREFKALNRPIEGRVTRYIESIQLMRQLFSEEEVDFSGETYELSSFSLSPAPIQDGGPPIWCGGYADKALKRAAYLGDEWLPTWPDHLDQLLDAKNTYVEYLEEQGKDPDSEKFPVIRAVIIGEDNDDAVDRARKYYQPLVQGYLDQGYSMGVSAEEFDDIMDIADDRFIIGGPNEVVGQLEEFIEAYGTQHLIMKVHAPGMTHDQVVKTAELLGEEVLPHLRDD